MASHLRAAALSIALLALVVGCGSSSATAPSAPTTTTSTTTTTLTTTTVVPTSETAPPEPPTSPPEEDVVSAEAAADAVALEFLTSVQNEEVRTACQEDSTLLRTVDHPGAQYRVGVIGDSLTVQALDELTADTRFNWSVSSVCGARAEHYLGLSAIGRTVDLRPGLDAVLAAGPDALVIALGSNAVLAETYSNQPFDLAPGIGGMLEATAGVPCRTWLNVHTSRFGDDETGPAARWAYYAPHYDEVLAAFAGEAGVHLTDWDAIVAAGPPERLLLSDGVHLTPDGISERAFTIQNVLTGIANSCVIDHLATEAQPQPG